MRKMRSHRKNRVWHSALRSCIALLLLAALATSRAQAEDQLAGSRSGPETISMEPGDDNNV